MVKKKDKEFMPGLLVLLQYIKIILYFGHLMGPFVSI
jgi:hypothetical protein